MSTVKPKIYIAGPMTDIKDFNFPAFNAAEKAWRQAGWDVCNPASLDGGDTSKTHEYFMRRDLPELIKCGAIALLPGWSHSDGANLELINARACGLGIFDAITMQPFKETILEEALRLVHGARQAAYSHPADDFAKTALIWQAILGIEIRPKQVALCMCGVKISRETHKHKRDNLVDLAGYAETAQMVEDRLSTPN